MKDRDAAVCEKESAGEITVQIRMYAHCTKINGALLKVLFFFRNPNKNGSMLMKLF